MVGSPSRADEGIHTKKKRLKIIIQPLLLYSYYFIEPKRRLHHHHGDSAKPWSWDIGYTSSTSKCLNQ